MKHSLWTHTDDLQICLFTKDPSTGIKEALKADAVKGVTKVMSFTKLKKNYHTYQQRRELCAMYDMFISDERIAPMLPNKLGKEFFVKKKQPVPVKISDDKMQKRLEVARDSTYFFLPHGATAAVKVGSTAFSAEELCDNIMEAVPGIVEHIPRKWKGLQSIHLKTTDSVALPLFMAMPTAEESAEGEAKQATKRSRKAASAPKAAAADAADAEDDDGLSDDDGESSPPPAKRKPAAAKKRATAKKGAAGAGGSPAGRRTSTRTTRSSSRKA